MLFDSILDAAHEGVADALSPGDRAIDATLGNGHDTLFLARCVGGDGAVLGFDVQAEALQATRARLADAGIRDPVELHHRGHEDMAAVAPEGWTGTVGAVMFNLGYLPGSDKTCITRPATTIRALDAATELLRPGGVITAVLYTGHDGGAEEARAVQQWAEALDTDAFAAVSYRCTNRTNAPRLVAVQRTKKSRRSVKNTGS